jgi:carotenoid cleavage dioxygenase
VGRKTKYGYFLSSDNEQDQLCTGYFKVDLEEEDRRNDDAVVGHVLYGDGIISGEAQFAPSLDPNADEDDGYLMVFTYNTKTAATGGGTISELRIYETKTMSQDPVAVVKIPSTVPLGFHGTFVPAADITNSVTGEDDLACVPQSSAVPLL